MERLTFEGNFCDIAQCYHLPCPYDGSCSQKQVWERLRAYEDTGLTPEEVPTAVEMAQIYSIIEENKRYRALNVAVDRIKELARADREGRVVLLPCKVGGEVYSTLDDLSRLHQCRVTGVFISERPYANYAVLEPVDYEGSQYGITFGSFGNTVFLTREEAEGALRRTNNG